MNLSPGAVQRWLDRYDELGTFGLTVSYTHLDVYTRQGLLYFTVRRSYDINLI